MNALEAGNVHEARAVADEDRAWVATGLRFLANLTIAWQWLRISAAACQALGEGVDEASNAYYRAKLEAARYWVRTELADNARLAVLCESAEDSYLRCPDEGF